MASVRDEAPLSAMIPRRFNEKRHLRRITPTCIAAGSQVFEGQGQVKVPRKAAGDGALDPGAAGGQATRAEYKFV